MHINEKNQALSSEEQRNLQCNKILEARAIDQIENEEAKNQRQILTLDQLFNLPIEDTVNNIYEVVKDAEENEKETSFKYVQIHKKNIETQYSMHEVLVLSDVSPKILYEMAHGEKRLFSLINATVSHEMRNPTNSI